MIIDDVHDKVSEIATKVSRDNVLSGRSERLVPLLSAQAEKLSRADLHIHSTYSDGIPTIEQILEHTERQTNLDVIAITDHNTIDGSRRARDLWARGSYRFDFVVGEEVSTNEGHLLAL